MRQWAQRLPLRFDGFRDESSMRDEKESKPFLYPRMLWYKERGTKFVQAFFIAVAHLGYYLSYRSHSRLCCIAEKSALSSVCASYTLGSKLSCNTKRTNMDVRLAML